jgi:hypothetical protein
MCEIPQALPTGHGTHDQHAGVPATPPQPLPTSGGCSQQATVYDAQPANAVASLGQQLQAGLAQLERMGVNLGTTPGAAGKDGSGAALPMPVPGSPSGAQFGIAEAQQTSIPLVPTVDGRSLQTNLHQVADARRAYVQRLQAAHEADQRAGTAAPTDAFKLRTQQALSEQLDRVVWRVDGLVDTIDASEAQELMWVVHDSNATGVLEAGRLGHAMTRIEGSAANLPASYMQVALGAQQLGIEIDAELRRRGAAISAQAQGGGMVDAGTLQAFNAYAHLRRDMDQLLRQNLGRAMSDPAGAEQALRAALLAIPVGGDRTSRLDWMQQLNDTLRAPVHAWPNGSDVAVPA